MKEIDPSTPDGLRSARRALNLSVEQMARLMGHKGPNARSAYHKKEEGSADISPLYVRMMNAYLAGYRPDDWPDDAAE